jgi:hypothetical protein
MDPSIAKRYHERILQAAMQRYGIARYKIRLLDGFESETPFIDFDWDCLAVYL